MTLKWSLREKDHPQHYPKRHLTSVDVKQRVYLLSVLKGLSLQPPSRDYPQDHPQGTIPKTTLQGISPRPPSRDYPQDHPQGNILNITLKLVKGLSPTPP